MKLQVCFSVLLRFYICSLCLIGEVKTARILGFFPTPSRSHLIVHAAVADTLAEAGHTVTLITSEPAKEYCRKCHHFEIPTRGFEKNFIKHLIENPLPLYKRLTFIINNIATLGNGTLQEPLMQKFMSTHKAGDFDLLIIGYFFNDFIIGLGAHFQCPIIVSFMTQPYYPISRLVGNPMEIAYVPLTWYGFMQQPMDFLERVKNVLFDYLERFFFYPFMMNKWMQIYEFNFPPDRYPPMADVYQNVSLTFVNYFSLAHGPIRPMVPALIEIGGIQIKEQLQPLDNKLLNILNNTDQGVIYFSLGTNVHSSNFPADKAEIIFKVFSKLPYTVLMKWNESDTEMVPKGATNIILKSWLPQSDLLAHPNIKLFITHCGWGSVVESEYHGVPMLGIPLFADQHHNAESIQRKGLGLSLNIKDLTFDSLNSSIMEVLENPIYKATASRFSKLYRDRLTTPRQLVTYWVDYVIRYQGAKHLQSPAALMPWWELDSLDVYAFLFVILLVTSVLFVVSCKCLYRLCFSSKGKPKDNRRKPSKRKTH